MRTIFAALVGFLALWGLWLLSATGLFRRRDRDTPARNRKKRRDRD